MCRRHAGGVLPSRVSHHRPQPVADQARTCSGSGRTRARRLGRLAHSPPTRGWFGSRLPSTATLTFRADVGVIHPNHPGASEPRRCRTPAARLCPVLDDW